MLKERIIRGINESREVGAFRCFNAFLRKKRLLEQIKYTSRKWHLEMLYMRGPFNYSSRGNMESLCAI